MLKMAGDELDQVCFLIEECQGLDKIEDLQNHENQEIYKIAFEIIDKYFGADSENEDEVVAPSQSDGQYVFDVQAGGSGALQL